MSGALNLHLAMLSLIENNYLFLFLLVCFFFFRWIVIIGLPIAKIIKKHYSLLCIKLHVKSATSITVPWKDHMV